MTNTWVPCGNPCLGHVAPRHFQKAMPLVSTRLDHICYPVNKKPCQHAYHVSNLPCHMYGHAMCHPCSGDMCHPQIGPHVMSMSASEYLVTLPCVSLYAQSLYGQLPCVTSRLPTMPSKSVVWLYDLYNHLPCGTVRTV
jgi:hypothetical protein